MAKKRVQVERLRPSARLQTVARPVETYVRPAEVQVGESELGAFVRAIAPGMKTLADVQRQEALKKNREIERGNASSRAFDAKLGAGKALREAHNDWVLNSDEYMTLTPEEITKRRQDIMQPYFDQVSESGDELLAEAFNQDIQVGNLNWYSTKYDPEKIKYDTTRVLQETFTEINAILADPANQQPAFDDPYADPNKEVPSIAYQQIDLMLKELQKVKGIAWKDINAYAIKQAREQAGTSGRTALYRWLEKNNQLNVSEYADDVRVMNTRLATYDKAMLDAQSDSYFQGAIQEDIMSFLRGTKEGVPSEMVFRQEIKLPNGTTRKVSEEDQIAAFQALANKLELTPEDQMNLFYIPRQIVPTQYANAIVSGKSVFRGGELTDANVNLALASFNAWKFVTDNNISPNSTLVNDEDKKYLNALNYLINKAGIGGVDATPAERMAEALRRVQTIDLKRPSSVTESKITERLDTGMFDFTDLDEVKNVGVVTGYIREGVSMYMQMDGVTLDDAIAFALEDAKRDMVTVESTNGHKMAINLLNTSVTRQGDEAVGIQRWLNEFALSSEAEAYLESVGGDGWVVTPARDPGYLKIDILNEQGKVIGTYQEISIAKANSMDTFNDMLRVRMNQEKRDAAFITGSMATVLPPIEEFVTEQTVAEDLPTMEEDIAVTNLPIAVDVNPSINITSAREIRRDGEFTGLYLYEGTLPDGSSTMVKSTKKPEDVIPPEAIQTVPEAEPYDDAIMRIARQPEVEKTFVEALRDDVADVRSFFQKAFNYERIDEVAISDEVMGKILPAISDSAEGVGTFFEESYTSTKKKFSNLKAIDKAKQILSEASEEFQGLVSELQLDVSGLFARGKSTRGITVKEQAATARTIIAVQEASEKQFDVETQPQFDEALATVVEIKGGTAEDIINKIVMPIAYHESDGTLDPNLKQYGGGPGRGMLQIEGDSFKTYVQSSKNLFERIGKPVPEWLNNIPADLTDARKLSGNQQKALFLYAMLQHPTADLGQVLSGEQSVEDFWIKNWWAGNPKDEAARRKAFRKSMKKFTS